MRKVIFLAIPALLAAAFSLSVKPERCFVTIAIASDQETQPAKVDTGKTPTDTAKVHQHGAHQHTLIKDKGIGPIKEVKLGPIDQKMAKQGKTLFEANCSTCHELDKKKIGPPLRSIAEERAPEFVMNMILNPVEMQQKNEHIKALVKEYGVLMSDLKLKQTQARAILEYLRMASESKPSAK